MTSPKQWNELERSASVEAFSGYTETASAIIPEIDGQSDVIARGGEELIDTFQIDASLFDDARRSAIFTSLALKRGRDHEDEREASFVGNATFLLAVDHTHAFPDDVANHKRQLGRTPASVLQAVEDFEAHDLSEELTRHIAANGLFDTIKARLGEGVEPAIRVVNIGDEDSWSYYDLAANGTSEAEAQAKAARLHQNAIRFGRAVNLDGNAIIQSAFTVDNMGEQHIVVPRPYAEVLLAEEKGLALQSSLAVAGPSFVQNTLRHEFVHTQSPVSVGDEDLLGSSLEERRAEWFSGDKREYEDVKEFYNRLGRLTGKHITEIFDTNADLLKSGSAVNLYESIGAAGGYGVDMISELAVAQPAILAEHIGTSYTKALQRALGGPGEILLRHSKRLRDK